VTDRQAPRGAAEGVSRGELARGAGLAGLARGGAVIEAVAQPLFTWMFGIATYGIYVVLWGVINFLSNLIDLGMTAALQRTVPAADEEASHGLVKAALLIGCVPATLIALIISLNAETVAAIFSTAPEDRAALPSMIAIFAWALPLWTFIEIATAAARARRAFGPEIRLRIFWEQVARIGFALLFFAVGFQSRGLILAHLCSLAVTAALCIPLLGRYYDLKRIAGASIPAALARTQLGTGLALQPTALARRLLIDAPSVVLNLMLPGAAGATAAGLFEIARKLSTVPLIVKQAFHYVMAPISAAQARADRAQIGHLYRFASRVSTALVIPLSGLLVFAGPDILSVYRPEAAAALPLLAVLVASRAWEAIIGPAQPVIETLGHRGLPLLNSFLAVAAWAMLATALVPLLGAMGMAIAVATGTTIIAVMASIELRVTEGLAPFDRALLRGLVITLAGVACMALVGMSVGGVLRFSCIVLLWAATSWAALRWGLKHDDIQALGGLGRRLRLLPQD
jgi:O-antigen/teichoic acid export membrane protein